MQWTQYMFTSSAELARAKNIKFDKSILFNVMCSHCDDGDEHVECGFMKIAIWVSLDTRNQDIYVGEIIKGDLFFVALIRV